MPPGGLASLRKPATLRPAVTGCPSAQGDSSVWQRYRITRAIKM
nr:MAG TPA: hypothetical protein [Caudoviricetes sp.]